MTTHENTPAGMSAALASVGGNQARIWIDGAVIRVLPPLPIVVPDEVTMRQAQRALLAAGLLDAVEAAINALPEPPRRAALIDWTKSSALRRDSQFVAVLAPSLGLDSAALDALFIAASKLTA